MSDSTKDPVLEEIALEQMDAAALTKELAERILEALSAERTEERAKEQWMNPEASGTLAELEAAEAASREAQARVWNCLYGVVRPRLQEAEG